jgi:hypothetical protein
MGSFRCLSRDRNFESAPFFFSAPERSRSVTTGAEGRVERMDKDRIGRASAMASRAFCDVSANAGAFDGCAAAVFSPSLNSAAPLCAEAGNFV